MNVLKPNKKNAITVLLANNLSQHEICRKTGIDRKTIRKYAAILANEDSQSNSPINNEVTANRIDGANQNPPPRPPGKNQASEAVQESIHKYGRPSANEDFQSKSPINNEVTADRIDGVNQNPPLRPPGKNQASEAVQESIHKYGSPTANQDFQSKSPINNEVTADRIDGVNQNPPLRPPGKNQASAAVQESIHKYSRPSANEDFQSKSPINNEAAAGPIDGVNQNPSPRPPGKDQASEGDRKIPAHAKSACKPHQEWIEAQIRLGRNAVAIYQDLVELFGFTHKYNSVKRFVRALKQKTPKQFDRLEYAPGEEAQVDYGTGAPTLHSSGKYRRPRLFVMTLKYSRRSFRKVVWESGQEVWAKLHEEGFRYFGGCTQYVVLDNLKEGVIKPDIFEPELNPVYDAVLKHYGVVADPARVRDPDRKGTVENAVQHTQNTALKGRKFESIEKQNEFLNHWEERWASKRIHGRMKRQVEEMFQEEKPYLKTLPLESFKFFKQDSRTVYDDGTVQIGKCYYSALPARIGGRVVVRTYDREIEIIDPASMEVIRRHPRSDRPGSVSMEEKDRIYNPSRETLSLLMKASKIGPGTHEFCKLLFSEEGRPGQRRIQGIVNLIRKYEARHVEAACRIAINADLRSLKAIKGIVERKTESAKSGNAPVNQGVTQRHRLIRPSSDYGAFWKQHASQGHGFTEKVRIDRHQLPQIWRNANWRKVICALNLEIDEKRRGRFDEIWIKSPFTNEKTASLHLNVEKNIYKDFSSGKGGGILNFCQDVLNMRGRSMNCYEVAGWMIENGISSAVPEFREPSTNETKERLKRRNAPVKADLRSRIIYEHACLRERGISHSTARYLGCGFLPEKAGGRQSPLNGRIVFQIRGVVLETSGLKSVILSHVGRSVTPEQAKMNGKYWGFPFFKGLEIYNQDRLLMDENARVQIEKYGLILVEGFFDAAKLVEAGCLNVGALMGSYITGDQIDRLEFVREQAGFSEIRLFFDRDEAGVRGTQRAEALLQKRGFSVEVFDWDQPFEKADGEIIKIPGSINDPGDMTVDQLRWLRNHNKM